jgi:hypothetical protein
MRCDDKANQVAVHDPDYRQSLQDFNTFLEKLTEKVIEIDETIPELPVKDIVGEDCRKYNMDPDNV